MIRASLNVFIKMCCIVLIKYNGHCDENLVFTVLKIPIDGAAIKLKTYLEIYNYVYNFYPMWKQGRKKNVLLHFSYSM